jgi:hypothetical protein
MNPFDQITTTLTGRSPWPFQPLGRKDQRPKTDPDNKTERMRVYLRTQGAATAATLADEADLERTDLVSALLKGDMARGSVFRRGHKYHWNPQFDAQHHQRLAEAASLLRANGFTVLKAQNHEHRNHRSRAPSPASQSAGAAGQVAGKGVRHG